MPPCTSPTTSSAWSWAFRWPASRCVTKPPVPPAHGAGIVATILGDAALRSEWEAELTAMRTRMKSLRTAFSDALVAATGSNALASLKAQNGMFSQLPVTPAQAAELREKQGVYMPSSGRINIAGLHPDQIPRLSEILAPYLKG